MHPSTATVYEGPSTAMQWSIASVALIHDCVVVKGLSPSVVYDVFVKHQDSDSRELTGPCTGNIHTVKTKGELSVFAII